MRSRFFCASALVLALTDLRAQTPAAPAAADTLTSLTNTLGMKLIPVPETTVLFSEFETRVAEFETFLKEGSYTYPRSLKPHFEQGSDHPVVGVNLQDAIAFCNWLTERERKQGKLKPDQLYRLPTNEEYHSYHQQQQH